ncbi:MAG: hypothetical protein WCQ77_02350 [Planctomycetota bacterium]
MAAKSPRLAHYSPVFAAIAVLFIFAAGDAWGCPNCKDAVNTADPEGLNMARGYFYSIIIMLAMPTTLIGSFSIYVWREMQRQKRAGILPPEYGDSQSLAPPVQQSTALPPHS